MNKRTVMLLFGLALVGGFFFLSRRASAETLTPSGGVQAGESSGALGRIPFSEVVTFPGGGTTPLAFEGTAPLPGARTIKGTGGPSIVSSAPRRLGLPGAIAGAPRSPKAPAPRAAPAPTPITVRRARAFGGPTLTPPGKGDPLRRLV